MRLDGLFAAFRLRVIISLGVVFGLLAFGVSTSQTSAYASKNNSDLFGARTISVVSANATPGSTVVLSIVLESQGDEVASGFTLNFDQTILSEPVVTLGSGVRTGTALTVNPNLVPLGRLGIIVDSSSPFLAGTRQVVSVRFNVSASAPPGSSVVSFGSTPVRSEVSNAEANVINDVTYQTGTVTIVGAVPVPVFTISGQVLRPGGNPLTDGLRNALVTLTDSGGVRRTVTTNSSGFYSFDNVAGGQTYLISARGGRLRFGNLTVPISDNLANMNFIAQQ